MARLSRWLALEGMDVEGLGTSEVDRFVRTRRAAGPQLRSVKALQPPLAYLQCRGVVLPSPRAPDDPADQLLERYQRYLAIERGLGKRPPMSMPGWCAPFCIIDCRPTGVPGPCGFGRDRRRHLCRGTLPQLSRGAASLTVTALRSLAQEACGTGKRRQTTPTVVFVESATHRFDFAA